MIRAMRRHRWLFGLGLVVCLFGEAAAAAEHPTLDPDAEWERLANLDRIVWSAEMFERYAKGRLPPVEERVWPHLGSVTSVAFSPDGRLALTGSWKEARLYDVATGKRLRLWTHKRPSYVIVVAFSPDGRLAATGAGDGTTRLWEVKSGEMIRQWGHWKDVEDLEFSPDGRYVATSAADRTAKLWDIESGDKLLEMEHQATVLPIAFTPDGQRVATGSMDDRARLWDIATGKTVYEWPHEGQIGALAISPDGLYALTGAADGTARLFSLENGKEVHRWTHEGTVYDVGFSPDGRYAVTAGADNLARLWNVETKELVHRLQHDGLVVKAVFSPDGYYVMTGARDRTARLWKVETGERVAEWTFGDGVRAIAFSPDGRLALLGSFDKTARLVDLGPYFDVGRAAIRLKQRIETLVRYNTASYAGPPPQPIKVDPRGPDEEESAYARRVTAARVRYEQALRDYDAKRRQFPKWRLNQIVEYAFFSVFGKPVIESVRYDSADGRFVVEIGSDSAVAGRVRRHILIADPVPEEDIEPMQEALQNGRPVIELAFDGSRLSWSAASIEANGHLYKGELIDDGPESFEILPPGTTN